MTDTLAVDFVDYMRDWASSLETMDHEPTFQSMLDPLHEGFTANFDNARAPYGQWPPHSPYTILLHGPHPLLILTGAMKRSVTQSGSDGRIEEFTRDQAIIGTSLFYAPYQQFGTAKIPARPFLWLEGSYVDRLHELFADATMARALNASSG